MAKNKTTIKEVVDRAEQIILKKDQEILFLKTGLKNALGGHDPIFLKMPDSLKIENFPTVQKVSIEKGEKPIEVKITNFPPTEKGHIQSATKEPTEKASKWVPEVVKTVALSIVGGIAKRLDMGIVMRADPEDKLRPQAVIVVDAKGRPVNMQPPAPMVNLPGGGGFGGLPIIAESLDQYHISDQDEATTTKYYGFITKDGHWYIMQNDTVAGTYRYARGVSAYTTGWSGRASLTYGYFDVIF